MSKGKTKGIIGKERIGCYGTSPDTPTKATPRPPARTDQATRGTTSGGGGVKGAGRKMRGG